MLVIHAVWSRDHSLLCIWGEDAELPRQHKSKKRLSMLEPNPHPFACHAKDLVQVLGKLGAIAVDEEPPIVTVNLLLPTSGSVPQCSPQLPRIDEDNHDEDFHFSPWEVPAVALQPDEVIDWLRSHPFLAVPKVAFGDTIASFAAIAKLALELVSRGRILPILRLDRDGGTALWQVRWDNMMDAERVDRLARSLPPLARADISDAEMDDWLGSDVDGWGDFQFISSRTVISEILEDWGDSIAYDGIAGRQLLPDVEPPREKLSPAENWVVALAADTPRLPVELRRLRKFADVLKRWHRRATGGERRTFRTCFRLVPPAVMLDSGGDSTTSLTWRIEFLLQPLRNPSQLVPAEAIWNPKSKAYQLLGRRLDKTQEHFLADLGRAVRLYPKLEQALQGPTPLSVQLDTDEAFAFLSQGVAGLDQAGFGVHVPNWWNQPAAQLGVRLQAHPPLADIKQGILGRSALVDYQWHVAVGDETLTLAELEELAKLKVPLVQFRGQWVALKREEIQAALDFFEENPDGGQMDLVELLRTGLGLAPSPVGLPVVGVGGDGWLGELLDGAQDAELSQLAAPKTFVGKLRPYQKRGLSWLSFLGRLGLGACLADDMGLGKTIQLLALLAAEMEGAHIATKVGPTLLICPMSIVGNWQRETARFTPKIKVMIHHGGSRLTGETFRKQVDKNNLIITTYQLAARDRETLASVKWVRIVLDEAQNIKNPATQTAQAIFGLEAVERIAMTGTPIENRLSELWSIMNFLNCNLLGDARAFKSTFARPIEQYREAAKADLLRKLTAPFVLRREKTDTKIIKDLPDKIEMKVYCNLTREQVSLYKAVVDEMMDKVDTSVGIERKGHILATMVKLKQVCNHPGQLLRDDIAMEGRSGKLERLEDILSAALSVGDRVLCFTQYAAMGKMLRTYLQERLGQEVLFLHGGSSKNQRDQMVSRFQSGSGPSVFILSVKAGGTGLNLTAATHVVHYDRWWNPAVEDQATDRAFRIGQKRNVQVRKLICAGTLEEKIDQMIDDKRALADQVVGSGEAWLTELSTDALREMVTLTRDALRDLGG